MQLRQMKGGGLRGGILWWIVEVVDDGGRRYGIDGDAVMIRTSYL